jgi:hypothetical protein
VPTVHAAGLKVFCMKKSKLDLAVLLIPLLGVAFIVLERRGVRDHVRGLDRAEEAAKRFDLSYAPGASAPVREGDAEWSPLITLIRKYSQADLPANREPKVLARNRALSSAEIPGSSGSPIPFAEWTSPGTPLILIYKDWPGNEVQKEDYRIVGTIGDLHSWIERSKSDFHSNVMDIILTVAILALGLAAWLR